MLIASGRSLRNRQTKVGCDDTLFLYVKFRRMVTGSKFDGEAPLASEDGHRVVPVLRWMRSGRPDELPQNWNVLWAEMFIIESRPEDIPRAPGPVRPTGLPPGCTGLAQINGRYGTDARYELGYGLQYPVSLSTVIGVQILFRTVWVVLSRRV